MFAVLALDREPMQWAQFPAALSDWTKGAGGVAAFAVAIWCLAYFLGRRFSVRVGGVEVTPQDTHPGLRTNQWSVTSVLFAAVTVAAAVCYALAGLIFIASNIDIPLGSWAPAAANVLLIAGGGCALAAVLVPVVMELARFSPRRIWALARLSLKEAFRKRIVWGFSAMALIFLFADWFVPYKPEDQLRNYVRVIYWSLTPLFWLVACWLGAFGIPTEVKNQSIHTIVTKPVERFEIVLGRFLGYGVLLTGVLLTLTGVSLLYVWRGVRDEAKKESYTARVPIYAEQLSFLGTKDSHIGENVGRVWEYRSYISGPNPAMPQVPRQYAVWSFSRLPSYTSDPADPIYVEFSFDIYRLTKGKEDRGVDANFTFADGGLRIEAVQTAQKEMQEERSQRQGKILQEADDKRNQGESQAKILDWKNAEQERLDADLIAKHGVFEISAEVLDYHTQALGGDDPQERKRVGLKLAQLFDSLRKKEQARLARDERARDQRVPALNVFVGVDRQHASAAQKLGVAKRDFYVLADTGPFWLNFVKGIIGMWFTVMLILAIAVACSTYFSGVISLLVSFFMLLAGYFKESFVELAQKTGGPLQDAYRLFSKSPGAVRLDESPTANLLRGGDEVYRFFVRLVLNIFPDIGRYDLQPYVANGFDISWSQVLFLDNLVPLAGYVLPCAVLAFYLMKFREVANPT
jgi:hypothetical protein